MKSGKRKSSHYLTTGRKMSLKTLTEIRDDPLCGNHFRLPPDLNSPDFAQRFWEDRRRQRERERRGGCANHHNYRSRLSLNLPERLYVPDEKHLPGKSITDDLDRDFYTLVAGRKIKTNKKIREYIRDIRNCFLTKLKIGYCSDEILKADENHKAEQEMLKETRRRFDMYLTSFEEFLKADHTSSMEVLARADAEKKKSQEREARIADLTDRLRRLEAELLIVEEKWSTCRMYQKFLYEVSPSEWRKEHDVEYGEDSSSHMTKVVEEEDLQSKIDRFVSYTSRCRPPALYFTDPDQLQRIFHELETSNVIALTYCDNLEKPIQRMHSELKRVTKEFESSQSVLQEELAFMRGLVEEEEARADELRERTRKVVFGMCKDFIVNEENLAVTALVEDAYEDAIAANDYDSNMVAMMKEIEMKYENLMLTLDKFPNDVLGPTIRGYYRDQKEAEKEAKEAERKYHQMMTLLKRLSKSLTYPKRGRQQTATRRLVHRSEPRKETLQRFETLRVFTKEEKDREYFFGETCRNVGEAALFRPMCALSRTIFPNIRQ